MIRLDFVSNSSSTSFIIIGVCTEMDNIIHDLNKICPEYNTDDHDHYENTQKFLEVHDSKLSFEVGLENDDYVYIGLYYENMLKDETRKQFEDRIQKECDRIFNRKIDTVAMYTECGYS